MIRLSIEQRHHPGATDRRHCPGATDGRHRPEGHAVGSDGKTTAAAVRATAVNADALVATATGSDAVR